MKQKNGTRNTREGYHYNTLYWKNHFKALPTLNPDLLQVLVGMVLGDATLRQQGESVHVKFEQGHKQKEFVDHLVCSNNTVLQSKSLNENSCEVPRSYKKLLV